MHVCLCPDEELAGFSRLHRCLYGGISDTVLASSSYNRPMTNDTLMILWTFTCSSSKLCHMVWKRKSGSIQHLFVPWTFLSKFYIHYCTNLFNNPAVHVIYRHFSKIFGKFSMYSTSVPGCEKCLLAHKPYDWHRLHFPVKFAKSLHRPTT